MHQRVSERKDMDKWTDMTSLLCENFMHFVQRTHKKKNICRDLGRGK